MLSFMVIALPRSRTSWFANLLTTAQTLCFHDKAVCVGMADLDYIAARHKKIIGLADTSVYLYGSKLNAHPAKKLIIHRDLVDVEKSLGMKIPGDPEAKLQAIDGLHIAFEDIENKAEQIWHHLLPEILFDFDRYLLLKGLNVQPHFPGLHPPNQGQIQAFANRLNV